MKNLLIALAMVFAVSLVSCKKEDMNKETVVLHPDKFKNYEWILKERYEDTQNNSRTWVVKNKANQVVVLNNVSREIFWTKNIGDAVTNSMVVSLMNK